MRINHLTPPRASVLEACERMMTCALARANEALREGNHVAWARHTARLNWLTSWATEYLQEGVQ